MGLAFRNYFDERMRRSERIVLNSDVCADVPEFLVYLAAWLKHPNFQATQAYLPIFQKGLLSM
jgi:hypothetical protein